MRRMYSRLGEYRKIFLANYLCIGFVPGGKQACSNCGSHPRRTTVKSADASHRARPTLLGRIPHEDLTSLTARHVVQLFWEKSRFGQGCRNGRFGKRLFCPLPKTGGFDENRRKENSDIAFCPQKQGILLLGTRKSTKMTKMAGVTPAK